MILISSTVTEIFFHYCHTDGTKLYADNGSNIDMSLHSIP